MATSQQDRAIQPKDDDPEVWFNRGREFEEAKRYDDASGAYSKATDLRPDFQSAWFRKAFVLDRLKRWSEALEAGTKATQLKPDDSVAWYNQGIALNRLKRYPEAVEAYSKAIKLDPGYAKTYWNQGILLEKLRRRGEAWDAYARAVELDPDSYSESLRSGNTKRSASLASGLKELNPELQASLDPEKVTQLRVRNRHHCLALFASDDLQELVMIWVAVGFLVLAVAGFVASELFVTWRLRIEPSLTILTALNVGGALVVTIALVIVWAWLWVDKQDDKHPRLLFVSTITVAALSAGAGLAMLDNPLALLPLAARQMGASILIASALTALLLQLLEMTWFVIENQLARSNPHAEALHQLVPLIQSIRDGRDKWGDQAFMSSIVLQLERAAQLVELIPARNQCGDPTTNQWFCQTTSGAANKLRSMKRLVLSPTAESYDSLNSELIASLPPAIMGTWEKLVTYAAVSAAKVPWWQRLLSTVGHIIVSFLPLAGLLGYQAVGPTKLPDPVFGAMATAAVLWVILTFAVMDPLYEVKAKALPEWSGMVFGGKSGGSHA